MIREWLSILFPKDYKTIRRKKLIKHKLLCAHLQFIHNIQYIEKYATFLYSGEQHLFSDNNLLFGFVATNNSSV